VTRIAAVAGSTGLVGAFVVAELAATESVARVRLFGRRPSGRAGPRLEEWTGDLGSLPERIPATEAFCCLGTTMRRAGSRDAFRKVDFDYVLRFARAVRTGGAERFLVVSSLGASTRATAFYSRVKGEMEAAVAAIGFPALVILRPSLLTGPRSEFRIGERVGGVVLRLAAPILVGRARRVRPVGAEVVARAMVRLAAAHDSGVRVVESDELARIGG
jgi:uncharacterized protein YbjT (DUF2867 family)